jgi:hypothetical protein
MKLESSDKKMQSVLHRSFIHSLNLPQWSPFLKMISMEAEAERLVKEIAYMDNVYGFCARHYIKEGNCLNFLLQINKEINEGSPLADKSLKADIQQFVDKYNELQLNDQ